MRVAAKWVSGILAVIYPFAVYWGLTHGSPRSVGLIGLGIAIPLFGIRVWGSEHGRAALRVPVVVLALLTLGAVFDDQRFVLAMPVILNVALLALFAASLRSVPMIERFARIVETELAPAKAQHCQQATVAWCVFFAGNALLALALALFARPAIWAVYNGGIAYGLMGVMFAGEYIVRRYRFREYGAGPHDRLLAKVFPRHEAHS